jgi:uncharacterized RDD family membrane protein YckC
MQHATPTDPAPSTFYPPGEDPRGYYQGLPLAGWVVRAGAMLIDVVGVIYGPMLIGVMIAGLTGSIHETPTGDTELTGVGGVIAGLLVLVGLGLGVYNAFVRQGRTGQTFGKQLLGLRLVRMRDGQPIGIGLAIGRHLLHWLDSLPLYVGWLWPLWDARRQTFADKLAGTVVLAKPSPQAWYNSPAG